MPSTSPDMNSIHILFVEDNRGDTRLAREALKQSKVNHILHHVEDGLPAPQPDLILLDINEFIEVLERRNFWLKTVRLPA
jgi:CheY-like chemotaxis protein